MRVIIKEWPNKTATIMTENGQVVWTFSTVDEARTACREWHGLHAGEDVRVIEAGDPFTRVA